MNCRSEHYDFHYKEVAAAAAYVDVSEDRRRAAQQKLGRRPQGQPPHFPDISLNYRINRRVLVAHVRRGRVQSRLGKDLVVTRR